LPLRSRTTYRQIGVRNRGNPQVKQVLDIGTATGGPLSTIVDCFQQARVLGIDYNQHYVPACRKLFQDKPNVEIRHMNFYDLEKEEPETLFDVIIFGSSFMILPDQAKALEIARSTSNSI
jgi:trans-aconitate methyltransferase